MVFLMAIIMVDYHQTNQKIDTGPLLKRWPFLADHGTYHSDKSRRRLLQTFIMPGCTLSLAARPHYMKQSTYTSIQEKRLQPWKGEEEVRFAWNKAREDATGLHLFAKRDRHDASYNHVIIECKAPVQGITYLSPGRSSGLKCLHHSMLL